ncbi:indolepyruvate ferredoxin oxidoreductase family protein [Actinomadura viridis]|uniref:indolepyruvate ferredoxin oxidoreductase family protein n=1 Tax=Actinomadura viridis TaxID=58110 RepID=UPI0036CCD09A
MRTTALPIGREVALADRYDLREGRMLMTGVQALVRAVFDQLADDREAGRRVGGLVSGYPGSPLGGLDAEFARNRARAEELGIVHRPAVNEELGATSVWGSQLAPGLEGALVDGVLGVWYGKAPGVDRAADALRHANHVGAHPLGGLVALCGDDPACKSSTLPSASESLLAALRIPVFYPGSPQEVLTHVRHAVAASRASGLCTAIKVVADVADAVATVDLGAGRIRPAAPTIEGEPYRHVPSASLLPPATLRMEETLAGPRLALARAYLAANDLNRVVADVPDAWLGIVAAGPTYYDLREAMHMLGLTEEDLGERGVRLLKLDVLWPLDAPAVRAFADGLDSLLVVEEKGAFVEASIRNVLYDLPHRPRILGERDERGEPLIGAAGTLDAERLARVLSARLVRRLPEGSAAGVPALPERPRRPATLLPLVPRTPYFCSGCPHNRSTEAPDDAHVGAGIGCHGMMTLFPEGRGRVTGLTQMGGEGAQWIGQAPFTATGHLFQNLGDGTFTHSGSLAVRAAVAAGVDITYKLLHNGVVAMTGAQDVVGGMGVPELTRWLELEGVRRVVVTADDLSRYRGVRLASIASLRPRADLPAVQEELRAEPGVTVIIHDQVCAADKRRLWKRGSLPVPATRVAINERVCEGCGDCGRKSHCVSLLPVETEFGSKTRIQQSSCNLDESCVEGDCPSFVTVVPGAGPERPRPRPPGPLPEPPRQLADRDAVTVRLIGVGGTGVVTIAQVLGMAALLDGRRSAGLDQTGLAQKGGPVVSDVRILAGDGPRSSRAPAGGVDAYLAFDLLGAAAEANLATADPGRTVAVVSTSHVPRGQDIGDPAAAGLPLDEALRRVDAVTRAGRNVHLDAVALAERLFGDHMAGNVIVLGAAWQAGLIPLSLAAMEGAFAVNGVQVDRNLLAFAWGRAVVAAPEEVTLLTASRPREAERPVYTGPLIEAAGAGSGSAAARVLGIRIADLIGYQGERYARAYAEFVGRVARADPEGAVTETVARELHRLMAYKDEYEVARLLLDPAERARIEEEFGPGARVAYRLHPPLLRALGLRRKLTLGGWFVHVLRVLRRLRFLRGTPFDPFGAARVRRVERALPREYRALVERALPYVASEPDLVREICELPGLVRGYEEVKMRGVERYRERARLLEARLGEIVDSSAPGAAGRPGETA